MKIRFTLYIILLTAGLFAEFSFGNEDETATWQKDQLVHIERSAYRDIYVIDKPFTRCLAFSRLGHESCRYKRRQDYLYFDYAKAILSGVALTEMPRSVLMIGLGGGSIASAFARLFPKFKIVIVELDQAMYKVARSHFDFEATANMEVVVSDGRHYVKRAKMAGKKFDIVILDAFGDKHTPPHLATREFFEEVKSLLTDDGVFLAHADLGGALRNNWSVTAEAVFGEFKYYDPRGSARLYLLKKNGFPSDEVLRERVQKYVPKFQALHVSIDDYVGALRSEKTWDPGAKILTDQYSPTEQLSKVK